MLLKYGTNPNQAKSSLTLEGHEPPIRVLNGTPGYINILDALNGWQLVKELKSALSLPCSASFKHTSPAGAAIGLPLTDELKTAYCVMQDDISPLCAAYIRARGADRLSSFGDFIALSDNCDLSTAKYIAREVSDGIIAPGYDNDALNLLKSKRGGNYIILEIDKGYDPPPGTIEERQIYGLTLAQERNDANIGKAALANIVTANKSLTPEAERDLIIALITLKYTQSNSVCYTSQGQVIGVGAGQQSRIHCTRLAGDKADIWRLRQHPKTLSLPFVEGISRPARDNSVDAYVTGGEMPAEYFTSVPEPLTQDEKSEWIALSSSVSLASDGFFPFSDNIERAARSGVEFIAQPGGSVRDAEIIACCDNHGIAMAFTGIRLFYH